MQQIMCITTSCSSTYLAVLSLLRFKTKRKKHFVINAVLKFAFFLYMKKSFVNQFKQFKSSVNVLLKTVSTFTYLLFSPICDAYITAGCVLRKTISFR